MLNSFFLVTLCALLVSSAATAQSTASIDTDAASIDWSEFEVVVEGEDEWSNFELVLEKDDNWTFHTNANGKLLYIDFESLGGKMSRLLLKSEGKDVVVEDNHLYDLPVNTIYEVNLEKLPKGRYFVELYTYSQEIIRKEITVQ